MRRGLLLLSYYRSQPARPCSLACSCRRHALVNKRFRSAVGADPTPPAGSSLVSSHWCTHNIRVHSHRQPHVCGAVGAVSWQPRHTGLIHRTPNNTHSAQLNFLEKREPAEPTDTAETHTHTYSIPCIATTTLSRPSHCVPGPRTASTKESSGCCPRLVRPPPGVIPLQCGICSICSKVSQHSDCLRATVLSAGKTGTHHVRLPLRLV